jgi:2-polyprenyl-3-methyl-5-hydroxy-6-metoxy-1,4-benzoquinol methylase
MLKPWTVRRPVAVYFAHSVHVRLSIAGVRSMPLWSLPPSREPELMDDPGLPEAEHVVALAALARINAVSRTSAQIARRVASRFDARGRQAASRLNSPLKVIDVACGGGDVTIGLAVRLGRLAALRGRAAPEVIGIDLSEVALERARRQAAARGVAVHFLAADITAAGCPPCDVAVSSLFLHHLDDTTATRLLESLAVASRFGVVISDLIRSRLGLALAVVGTTLLSRSRVARVDGPRSVRAARTPAEYRALFAAAGMGTATVRRTWPERVLVDWPGRGHAVLARAS